ENSVIEYIEDIDDSVETGDEELEAIASGELEEALEVEETEEAEDHEETSSDAIADVEIDSEPSDMGEEGGILTDPSAELEFLEGFDESILYQDRESLITQEPVLDAWYAEYGDEASIALALQGSRVLEEVVIGKDDRIRVHNTTAYPWRTICSLIITAKDGSRWIGTGWLVGNRTVITAGHVVYMHKRGGWVRSIEVIPGRNASRRPFGSCRATHFRSVKGWTNKKKRSHDYGCIILPKNCEYGKQLGYFGYANLNFFSLLGLKVNLSGYPGDKTPAGSQWWHARRIKFVTPRTIVYNIDTAGGQSGSPVWRLRNGQRHVIGIHTNGSKLGNSATRITKPVFKNIKKWKALGM
ncbi:MAG: serine protease, partial [Bacteroidota bacterium]